MAESCIGTRLRSKRCIHETLAEVLRVISNGDTRVIEMQYNARIGYNNVLKILQSCYDAKLINLHHNDGYTLFHITEKGEFYLAIAEEFIKESNKIVGKVKR